MAIVGFDTDADARKLNANANARKLGANIVIVFVRFD